MSVKRQSIHQDCDYFGGVNRAKHLFKIAIRCDSLHIIHTGLSRASLSSNPRYMILFVFYTAPRLIQSHKIYGTEPKQKQPTFQRRSRFPPQRSHQNITALSPSSSHSYPHRHRDPLPLSAASASPRHPRRSSRHQTRTRGNPCTSAGRCLRSGGAGHGSVGPRSWRRVCGWCGRRGWCGSRRSGRR